MRIALLTEGIYPLDIGGIQKHSYFLAKYLSRAKVQVDIFFSSFQDEILNWKDYFSKVDMEYLNFIKIQQDESFKVPGHYIYSSFLFSKKLFLEVNRNGEYDLIYAQGFTSWYFLKKSPYQRNLISNLHGLEMFQASFNLKNQLEQLILKFPAKKIIKNSQYQISLGGKLTEILHSNGAKRGSVVELPNGISKSWIAEPEMIKNSVKNRLKFIFVGRYERRKGIEEFQEVILSTINQTNYQVEFIGPIAEENHLKHPNVKYSGQISNSNLIKEKLIKADLLVCPSYSEGMPTVILEAMACGCAIIATDVGAVNTMVDNKNGWLIQGDVRSGLSHAISQALDLEKNELIDKKMNSINRVQENFTWDKIIEKTLKEINFIKSN